VYNIQLFAMVAGIKHGHLINQNIPTSFSC